MYFSRDRFMATILPRIPKKSRLFRNQCRIGRDISEFAKIDVNSMMIENSVPINVNALVILKSEHHVNPMLV